LTLHPFSNFLIASKQGLPFYKTEEGKVRIGMQMLTYDVQAINLGSRETPTIFKEAIVTKQRVFSPRFSSYG